MEQGQNIEFFILIFRFIVLRTLRFLGNLILTDAFPNHDSFFRFNFCSVALITIVFFNSLLLRQSDGLPTLCKKAAKSKMVSLLITWHDYFEILLPQLIIFDSVLWTKQFLPMSYLFPFSFFLLSCLQIRKTADSTQKSTKIKRSGLNTE